MLYSLEQYIVKCRVVLQGGVLYSQVQYVVNCYVVLQGGVLYKSGEVCRKVLCMFTGRCVV